MNGPAADLLPSCASTGAPRKRANANQAAIPFALRDGRLFEPLQVENGLRCRCVCPGCGAPVIAKHAPSGKVRPHFAHEADSACSTGAETALHLAAKQLIADRMTLFLPKLDAEARGRVAWLPERVCLEPVHQGGPADLDQVVVEKKLGRTRPDLMVATGGQDVLVEVAVTHFVDHTKLEELTRLGMPAVEFDLSDLREFTFQELERRLFEKSSSAKWLYHPSEPAAKAKAKVRLDALLASDRQQWEKERADQVARELELEKEERARALKRLAAQKAEAQRKAEQRAGDRARAAEFKAMAPDVKLTRVCRYLGANPASLPDFVRLPVRSGRAIAAPLQVWQTAVFAGLVHPAAQNGELNFNVDTVLAWLKLRFDFNESAGTPAVPVWDYLVGLTAAGALTKLKKQEFLVTVDGWCAAVEMSRESLAPGKHPQVWSDVWPESERASRVATAFESQFGNRTPWQRIAGLLPDIRAKESPIQTSLHYTASVGANPDLLRRFFLSAGFTKLG